MIHDMISGHQRRRKSADVVDHQRREQTVSATSGGGDEKSCSEEVTLVVSDNKPCLSICFPSVLVVAVYLCVSPFHMHCRDFMLPNSPDFLSAFQQQD